MNKRYLSACLALTMLLSLLQPLTAFAQENALPDEPSYTIRVGESQINGVYTVSPDTQLTLVIKTSETSVSAELPEGLTAKTEDITAVEKNYEGDQPTQLVDKLPEGLTYDDGSFTVVDASGRVVSTDGALAFDSTPIYKNTVKGADENGDISGLEASAVLNAGVWANEDQPLYKGVEKADENRTVKWTVTVYPMGLGYETLTLIDTQGAALSLVDGTVEVNGAKIDSSKYTYEEVSDPNGSTAVSHTLTIPIYEGGHPQFGAADKYVITYHTKISDDWYTQSMGAEAPNNSAALEWSFPKGIGPIDPPQPIVVKPTEAQGVTQAMLTKYSPNASYNHEERLLEWVVTINPNQVNITSAAFADTAAQAPMMGAWASLAANWYTKMTL